MLEKPKLSLVARQGLKELREKWKIEPTLEEQIWLHELGKRVENPPGTIPMDVLGMPARIGGLTLWPFTIGAAIWWRKYASAWFENSEFSSLSLAFTLAHARQPEVFCHLTTLGDALEAIEAWAQEVTCTDTELAWAIDRVLPGTEESDADGKEPDYAGLIASLIKAYGGTREYWVWQETQDAALGLIAKAHELEQAATHKAGVTDAYKAAMSNFRKALMSIVEEHKDAGCTDTVD